MEGRGKKVLVAEDYVSNRNLLACLLEQAQYEVHLAGDGYEALERMFNGQVPGQPVIFHYAKGYPDRIRLLSTLLYSQGFDRLPIKEFPQYGL